MRHSSLIDILEGDLEKLEAPDCFLSKYYVSSENYYGF